MYVIFIIGTLLMKKNLASLLIAVLVLLSVARASDPAQKFRTLPKGISLHQLDNGMTVLLIENPALPMVGANVIVKVGSAYESFSTSGMSHMLEHLLFNGTAARTQKQLYDDVDRIGAYNNASTADFYTNFMIVTPAHNMRKGLEIQSDMLFHSILPAENFQKEKGIVLEEISKSMADPKEQMDRNVLSILYRGHALSLPTLGTYATIQSLTRDDVFAFYKNNYVPNNMILTVIGNFQTSVLLPVLKEIYGKAIPGMVRREPDPELAVGFQQTGISAHAAAGASNRFYDGTDMIVQVFYPLPHQGSSEYFQLLDVVLEKKTTDMQSALKAEFPQNVKSLQLSTSLSHLGNYLEASITVSGDADQTALVNSLSAKMQNCDFMLSADAVTSEATQARTEFVKNIEKPHMFGIYHSDAIVKRGIDAVLASFSGEGFFAAAKELGSLKIDTHPVVIIQSPSAKKTQDGTASAGGAKYFVGDSTASTLIAVRNDASNLLAIHYLVKHKAVFESKYGKDASKILHECLDQRLKSAANQKLSARFGLTFTVNDNPFIPMDDIYLHPDFGYIRVEGLADDLSGATAYLNSQFLNFVPTQEECDKAVEKYKNIDRSLAGGDKSKKIFEETYKAAVYEPNPYAQVQPALTYASLAAFAKEYFTPSNMIISAVSPADPDSVKHLFIAYTGRAMANEPAVYTPTLRMQPKPVSTEKSGNGERSYLFWGFVTTIDPADAPALQALSLVLSDEIVFTIREKQGRAYNMAAGVEVIQDKALFYINQGTRPKNVDTLLLQYPGFFKRSAVDNVKQEQLEKSINMYLGRIMFRRLSSINQAFYLGSSEYLNHEYTYDKSFLEKLKNVKLADVVNAAHKYLTVKNPVSVVIR